jgi:hypothetical protein
MTGSKMVGDKADFLDYSNHKPKMFERLFKTRRNVIFLGIFLKRAEIMKLILMKLWSMAA